MSVPLVAPSKQRRVPRFASTDPASETSASSDDDGLGGPAPASRRRTVVYRALREDEITLAPGCDSTTPVEKRRIVLAHGGLQAPTSAILKLPGAHVQAGSKAKTKSTWVS